MSSDKILAISPRIRNAFGTACHRCRADFLSDWANGARNPYRQRGRHCPPRPCDRERLSRRTSDRVSSTSTWTAHFRRDGANRPLDRRRKVGDAASTGMWIPPATEHQVRIVGAVCMQSLYMEPNATLGMPNRCQVVGISPFMRSLMTEALSLPLEYELEGRAGAMMELIQHEMQQLPVLPLSLSFPTHGPLSALCRQFVEQPNIHETIDAWADALSVSRRPSRACSGARPARVSLPGDNKLACFAPCLASPQAKPSPQLRST